MHASIPLRSARRFRRVSIATGLILAGSATPTFAADPLVATLHSSATMHLEQQELDGLVRSGDNDAAFDLAFEFGDAFFETVHNALDGVGAKVGNGQLFTRVPRADLSAAGEWADHTPARATGPNAASCASCHIDPAEDGSGSTAANVHRDPGHTGSLDSFIQRNTPHLFGAGALQRLAEEMTIELHHTRDRAIRRACDRGIIVEENLRAKGVSFGTLRVDPQGCPNPSLDTSHVEGVSEDLVVRPFQWKGVVASLRDFNRGAAHNEIGMQGIELVGRGNDGDGDGVVDELSVGDLTALTVYAAAQPRPLTTPELADLGLIPDLGRRQRDAIRRGERVFRDVRCESCHTPRLVLDDPVFREPSALEAFRDATFPSGDDPLSLDLDFRTPVTFDLTRDQPDNHVERRGETINVGAFRRSRRGGAIIELFGDMKRHDMGPGLAETIDEAGTGASVFLTENLWGVGSTAPYLHDGRATTLAEAILAHGGEAAASRDAFVAAPQGAQADLIAFLESLVLFKLPED